MAAIGKIRSWGPVLVTVIGLALFAFIAEEMFRSCETSKNNERQQVGEVLGVPYLVLHLVQLLLREVVAALGHLDDLLVLVDKTLEVLDVDFLT